MKHESINWKKLTDELPDLEEHVVEGTINIVPLGRNMKTPFIPDWNNRVYSLTDSFNYKTKKGKTKTQEGLKYHKGNYGILIGYGNKENDYSIACIDIDGYTNSDKDHDIKNETQKLIYEALKDLPYSLQVRTQSGGYHIYYWTKKVNPSTSETSHSLCFPDDFEIEKLAGKPIKDSIEIFTNQDKKQTVLPSSTIYNKATCQLNKYEVISELNHFTDIDVVDDINELVIKHLTSKGFKYQKPTHNNNTTGTITEKNTSTHDLKTLNNKEINTIIRLTAPLLRKIDGQKHTGTLYLGGYLSRNITLKSASKIANGIIQEIGELFDDPTAFKTTLLQNYNKPDTYKGGLPKFCEIVKSHDPDFNTSKFIFEMNTICRSKFIHSILTKEYHNNKKKYLDIDYSQNKISTHTWNRSKNKNEDGTETWNTYYTDTYDLLNMCPTDIFETYNILDKNANSKICLKFYRNGMPHQQLIEGNDITSIEKQLAKRPGIVLKPQESKGVLNEIIREYVKLEQIHAVEEIPVQGIFLNPSNNKLARSDKDNNTPITLPTKDQVSQAINIWEDLYNVYPGDSAKLAHILRWGLISPFSYILKTKYTWYPMLFLFGASRTSKTTLAEISLSPYTTITDEISIGGGSFDTPYRIGNALSRQGIGTIINEPGNTIASELNLEVIKRAVESPYSREKQEDGVHVKIPAYSNMCYTSNRFLPTNDAFARRCDYLEFTKNERLTDEDIRLFNRTFNHQNWNNTRFTELRPIGDFLTYYIHENIDMLSYNREELEYGLLDNLYSYIGEQTPKWLKQEAELMDMNDTDNELLSEFRRMFMRDYRNLTRNSRRIEELAEDVGAIVEIVDNEFKIIDDNAPTEDFRKLVKAVIISNNIDYMYWRDGEILVNTSVKNSLKEFCGVHVTCKGLADYMKQEYKLYKYKGNPIRGFKIEFDEFINFLNGG